MIDKNHFEALHSLYLHAIKVYSLFDNRVVGQLTDDGNVDPFYEYHRTLLSSVVDLLSCSYNFSKDMEERLSLLSDELCKK